MPCMKRVPEHALHERGLERLIGIGISASSEEQRALLVPVINRWSNCTTGHMTIFD